MSKQLTLTVQYSKPGDVRKNTREKIWKMDLPVTAVTDPIQDLLLTLIPENEYGVRIDSYTYIYPGEKDQITDGDLQEIVRAVNKPIQERIEKSILEKQEKKEREEADKRKFLEECKAEIRFVLESELPIGKWMSSQQTFTRKSLLNGDIGYEFDSNCYRKVKDDLHLADEDWENFRNTLKLDYDQKQERSVREFAEKHAREEADRAEREKAQTDFVANWTKDHGSDRLKTQLQMGYDGIVQFYQEKLHYDFPELDIKLMEDAEDFDSVRNPTMEQLEVEKKAASLMCLREIVDTFDTAKIMTRVAFDDVQDEDEYGDPGEKTRVYYVVISGYRFGPKTIFPKEYTVAIQL